MWAEEDAAEASGRQQHGGGGSGGGTDVGAAATKALAGYQDVNGLIEAMGLLMDMHGTLQVGGAEAGVGGRWLYASREPVLSVSNTQHTPSMHILLAPSGRAGRVAQ